jgi:hypothetical protein
MNKKQKMLKIWLIFSTVIYGGLALLSIVPIMFSPMMFDSPGSEENSGILILLFGLLTFPILAGGSIWSSWRFYTKENFEKALHYSFLPFISFALMAFGAMTW